MRIVIIGLAIAGFAVALLGVLTSTGWAILVGSGAVVIAIVMAALAAPATRGER